MPDITIDKTLAGREATIAGRKGRFRVVSYETNAHNGATWFTLYGPVSSSAWGKRMFSHHRPDDVKVETDRQHDRRTERQQRRKSAKRKR